MPNDFEPRVGHRFTFTTDRGPGFDGIVRCEVVEVVERERLTFTWVGGPIDTVITFTLADVPGGTRLVLEQTGFRGLRAWIVSRILAIGTRVIYGRKLPALLDEMAGHGGASVQGEGCMTPRQRFWERALRFLWRSN